jgi:2-iminobutanoate/2-iminopropanoate deaminase
MKQVVHTTDAPQPLGPYSQAVIHNGILYVAGQGPVDPAAGKVVQGTIQEEARQALSNLKAIIEAAGFSLQGVLKTTCFLADMEDFAGFNQVYAEFFTESQPARTTVQAARLPSDIKVEIEAIVGSDAEVAESPRQLRAIGY